MIHLFAHRLPGSEKIWILVHLKLHALGSYTMTTMCNLVTNGTILCFCLGVRMTILDPDFLDRVYQKWKYGDSLADTRWPQRYQYPNTTKNQRFEDWLWTQGFTVVQKNKRRYLKFSGDERYLTIFILKHC
jgi:hypothetical protein